MKKTGISRREFLKGSAAGAVSLAAMGLLSACGDNGSTPTTTAPTPEAASSSQDWLGQQPQIQDSEIKETWNTGVLIVGAGNGGMMAAVKAADAGLDFRIIEQNTFVCDTRNWYAAADSVDALAAGKPIDRQRAMSELSRYASGKLDQSVVKVWLDESAAMHDYVKAIMDSMNQKCGVINHENGVEFWFELDCKTID